jgi:pimeloyl-ACP methyl ester carboxylesterase
VRGEVVLVGGLWMPTLALALLGARLARGGYGVRSFAYDTRAAPERNVERLARFVRDTCAGRPAHFVGHSLGGVLIFDMLSRHPDIAAGRVVLLGSPVRGCQAGRRLGAAALGRWMLGASRARWEGCEARWARSEPLGVVAGTLPLGLGLALGLLPGPNDGVVRVEETTVEGMAERALVRQGHSLLIVSARVARLVQGFLAQGRFA